MCIINCKSVNHHSENTDDFFLTSYFFVNLVTWQLTIKQPVGGN